MKAVTGSRSGQRPAAAERVTVALVPKAVSDLQGAVERTGLSKTDVINRAIILYEYLDARLSGSSELLIRDPESGHLEQIRFF
jgi:hypothetical protein